MRRTRRRKPSVQWLPGFRAEIAGEDPTGTDPGGIQGELAVEPGGEIAWDAFPLTYDYSIDNSDEDPNIVVPTRSLKDLVAGNEWRLRRIVGKAFIAASSDELDDPPAFTGLIDCAVGFIVVKTYDDGAPLADFGEVNPLSMEGYDDPWIWRRRWVLNPFPGVPPTNLGTIDTRSTWYFQQFPNTTAGYGSAVDGPHIDQKTARRIHRQERLFAVIAARQYSNFEATADMQINYLLDYRLLGSVGSASRGNRGNASR